MAWGLRIRNPGLYAAMAAGAVFSFIVALGPGVFEAGQQNIFAWQYQVFSSVCHQDPARSFQISGVQMAVCARCIGIYGAFMLGWLSMPIYGWFTKLGSSKEKYWLIAAILLNLIDVAGNFMGIWSNTHIVRLVLGGLFGWSLTLFLTNEFFNKK